VVDTGSSPVYGLIPYWYNGRTTTPLKALIKRGFFRIIYFPYLYTMTPIQQAYNEINELAVSSPTAYRAAVRAILVKYGAKETPVKKDKKCKA
jgi:predicted transcriptional regulator with HTH domain